MIITLLLWLFPIASGVAEALYRNVIKLTKVPNLVLLAGGYLAALPFYFGWLYLEGIPEVYPAFWWALLFHVPLWTLAMILTVEAHRLSPLLLTAPYLALTPAFLLITSPLMGGGLPTLLGVGGVLLITAGVYVLNTTEEQTNLWAPFLRLGRERGSVYIFLVAVIAAITSNLDYIALVNANAPFYLVVDHGLIAIITASLAFIYCRKGRIKSHEIKSVSFWPFLLFGTLMAGAVITLMLALEFLENVPYVVAGKRAGAILATVGLGLLLGGITKFSESYASEREHLPYRLTGTSLVVMGMIIIILWGEVF